MSGLVLTDEGAGCGVRILDEGHRLRVQVFRFERGPWSIEIGLPKAGAAHALRAAIAALYEDDLVLADLVEQFLGPKPRRR